MRTGSALGLLVVVLLAGCSLPAGGAGPSSTVTPAPVPDETTPLNLGPPVDVGDSLAPVMEAHQQSLNGTAFAYRVDYRGPFPSDPATARNVSLQAFVGANRSVYFLEAAYGGGVYRQWSNGTLFVSLRTGPETRRGGVGRPALPGDSQAAQLADSYLFPLDGTTVTGVVRDGETYRITATVDRSTRESLFDESRVPNASIRVVVDTDRRIERYRLEYTVVHDGTRVHGVEEYLYDTGPAVRLPRPPWVDNVIANESG